MSIRDEFELQEITPVTNGARRPSSVSQILRAINDDMKRGEFEWDVGSDGNQSNYKLYVAADRNLRQRAYRLAHHVYQSRGYVADENGLATSPYDAHPETLTILAQDDAGRDAGTISLVFDSAFGLPCDEIYGIELNGMRSKGKRLGEVTRLAIADEHRNSKTLLVRLFNFLYIFSRRVKGVDELVIEVNPRHVNYYRRLLMFEPAGPERPCPRVQGAPALLLRLDMDLSDEVMRLGWLDESMKGRTLYSQFYSWLEEGAVAQYLARTQTPMNEEDARHFGLEEAYMRFNGCAVAEK